MRHIAAIAIGLLVLGAQSASQSTALKDITVLDRDCKAGKSKACRTLGDIYREGTASLDKARAAAHYKQACDSRDSEACYALGLLYFDGSGVAKDPVRSAALFQQACEAGVQRACTSMGESYFAGAGVAKNQTAANLLWEMACAKGEPLACHKRATVLRYSERKFEEADKFFLKACDGGMQAGCQAIAMKLAIEGRRPPSNLKEVCARHILLKIDAAASGAEAKARQRADEILAALQSGTDFAQLARKFSEDEGSAKGGGDLGCFARGAMVEELESMAFALAVGEAGLAKSPFGLHVIQRVAKP